MIWTQCVHSREQLKSFYGFWVGHYFNCIADLEHYYFVPLWKYFEIRMLFIPKSCNWSLERDKQFDKIWVVLTMKREIIVQT